MNTREVFQSAFPDLVRCLPINDAYFKAELKREGLFSGDLEERVNAKDTKAAGVTLFLNEAIEPFLNLEEKSQPFRKLLLVMESFSPALKKLATEIKKRFKCKYCGIIK